MSDLEYVSWRESLVDIAAIEADIRCPEPVGPDVTLTDVWKWERRWNAVFHRAMERLMNDPFLVARFAPTREARRASVDGKRASAATR